MLNRNEIGTYLNQLRLNGEGVEIGIFKAAFSEIILSTWSGTLWLVDAWANLEDYDDSLFERARHPKRSTQYTPQDWARVLSEARRRVARFGDRAKFFIARSPEAANRFENERFDLVYVDANHAYEAVKGDLHAWYPKLKSSGLFAGHDYFDGGWRATKYGVKSAVDEFAKEIGCVVSQTSDKKTMPSWFWIKP